VQAAERRMYGDRSYFAQKEAGRNNAVELVSDDEVIQISSDEEDVSWFPSKSTTPRKAGKLDKGKGKMVEDSDAANNDEMEVGEAGAGKEDVEYYDEDDGGDGDDSEEL
jgi:hypothetical protein